MFEKKNVFLHLKIIISSNNEKHKQKYSSTFTSLS